MADHALQLMAAIQAALEASLPLSGGWHATRLETLSYPVGFIDLTVSAPVRGQAYYAEQHRGLISVWHRGKKGEKPSPREAFRLSEIAHRTLGASVLSSGAFWVNQFHCGDLTPQNPDGITWGRSFTFTAITHEVRNG